ncbi:hypothetical protein P171DRAFT_280963 [Karstenula rhodostoma CBS 690.94]|uniref:F-box domain-containing protein n=1 Tax=Karstenula rhodostoma CBS 690.94 TaxID=1392251 RepID=A0A9P4UBZ4_9PLEO|nr:hypothetical protein P171DRAFT_280963 [Karstenula rhodostoma CBS 690.94]
MATPPAFIDAFRALHTSTARAAAIAALADELSPYEWRQLQALVGAKSFHLDIVGTLPAELVFHIFSYLDISTPVRLQTVSRRWCDLLRSSELLKPALRAWYDNTVALEDASYADCLQRAQSIQRFRTGRCVQVAASKPTLEPSKRIALSEDFLVDVPHPFRQVRITNLRTGEDRRVGTEGRDMIEKFIASSELIACWNQAQTCYIFDYSATQRAKLRLPPSMNTFRACRGQTFICGGILNQHIELYLWDAQSQKGKTVRLNQPPFDSAITSPQCLDVQILPNPRSKTFTLFCTKTCEARWCGHHVSNMSIDYYAITFDGQLVQQNTFMIPLPAETTEFAGASITSIHPVDRNGGHRISVFCRYNHNGFTHMLHFDETLQTFSLPKQPTDSAEDVRTAWWKDSFYQIFWAGLQENFTVS